MAFLGSLWNGRLGPRKRKPETDDPDPETEKQVKKSNSNLVTEDFTPPETVVRAEKKTLLTESQQAVVLNQKFSLIQQVFPRSVREGLFGDRNCRIIAEPIGRKINLLVEKPKELYFSDLQTFLLRHNMTIGNVRPSFRLKNQDVYTYDGEPNIRMEYFCPPETTSEVVSDTLMHPCQASRPSVYAYQRSTTMMLRPKLEGGSFVENGKLYVPIDMHASLSIDQIFGQPDVVVWFPWPRGGSVATATSQKGEVSLHTEKRIISVSGLNYSTWLTPPMQNQVTQNPYLGGRFVIVLDTADEQFIKDVFDVVKNHFTLQEGKNITMECKAIVKNFSKDHVNDDNRYKEDASSIVLYINNILSIPPTGLGRLATLRKSHFVDIVLRFVTDQLVIEWTPAATRSRHSLIEVFQDEGKVMRSHDTELFSHVDQVAGSKSWKVIKPLDDPEPAYPFLEPLPATSGLVMPPTTWQSTTTTTASSSSSSSSSSPGARVNPWDTVPMAGGSRSGKK